MHGKMMMETNIHILPIYVIFGAILAALCELYLPHCFMASMLRIYFVLILGSWFFHVAFILYIPYPWPGTGLLQSLLNHCTSLKIVGTRTNSEISGVDILFSKCTCRSKRRCAYLQLFPCFNVSYLPSRAGKDVAHASEQSPAARWRDFLCQTFADQRLFSSNLHNLCTDRPPVSLTSCPGQLKSWKLASLPFWPYWLIVFAPYSFLPFFVIVLHHADYSFDCVFMQVQIRIRSGTNLTNATFISSSSRLARIASCT